MSNNTTHKFYLFESSKGMLLSLNRTKLKWLCWAIPAVLLIGAYIHMAFRYQSFWLFNTIVHERGKYTLLEVIFYFRHFIWELPMKTIYAFLLVGSFFYFGNPRSDNKSAPAGLIPYHNIVISGLLVLIVGGLAFYMTANIYGLHEALSGLFQSRTSELRPLVVGSHWRNHFLSNIVLYTTSITIILLYRLIINRGFWQKRKFGILLPITAASYILVTISFGINLDPFQIPSYIGHQLREIFGTDLTITMLLTIGILIHLEQKYDNCHYVKPTNTACRRKTLGYISWCLIVSIIISLFLITKVLTLDMNSEMAKLGSTAEWSKIDLFAWHFFEHSLDYIYTCALVYCIYLMALSKEQRMMHT